MRRTAPDADQSARQRGEIRPEGQRIAVALAAENGTARVLVDDEGPAYPPVIANGSGSGSGGCNATAVGGRRHGIGLAVVRELAELHGGRRGWRMRRRAARAS